MGEMKSGLTLDYAADAAKLSSFSVDVHGGTNSSYPGYESIHTVHGYNSSATDLGYTEYDVHAFSDTLSDDNVSHAVDTGGEGLYDVPPGFVALLSILYGTISFISVVGNALVILVVAKNRSMQTVTNFFIANLSVADVMIGIFSIPFQFQAALLQRWDLPRFLCPVAPFVKELTVNVSILTLTVIAVDRYRVVVYPLKPKCTKQLAKLIMSVVWGFSLLSALPAAVVFSVVVVDGIPQCLPDFPEPLRVRTGTVYFVWLLLIQYALPLAIISWAYFRIIHTIWFTKAPGSVVEKRDALMHKNKIKVIKMLMTVVGLFAFCWLPLQLYNTLTIITPSINKYRYINIIWFCSNWLAMSNSCYNPFIYGFLNEKFKQAFRLLIFKCPCGGGGRRAARHDGLYGDINEYHLRKSSSSPDAYEHLRVHCNGGSPGRLDNKVYVRMKGYDASQSTCI